MKLRCRIGYHKLGPAEHLQDSINSRTCEDCGKPFLYDGEVLIGDFVLPPIANQHSLTIQDWLDQVNESAPTKLELIEWKPIEQAKKDGTVYLFYRKKGVVLAAWDIENKWWMDNGDGWPLREPGHNYPDEQLDPTHFAELPKGPNNE